MLLLLRGNFALLFSYNTFYFVESACYSKCWKFYDFYLKYWCGQGSDYVYDNQDYYSDTGDSYDSSLIDDSELSDMLITLMSKRKYIQIIYT